MNAETLVGTRLGTCTLQQLIGQGSTTAVFLAQQSRPPRQVAVKVLLSTASLPPDQLAAFLDRFRRETDAAASLEHSNIVPVYEYGDHQGLAYLVMPYISGGTLQDIIEREGPLPLPKVVTYLEQLASALDFAHECGVMHQDIKPSSILLTPEGRLMLTDFGVVTSRGRSDRPSYLDYIAPEQVLGEPVDERANLYSLAVILYQMVTGTTPFQGPIPMRIAVQHIHTPPPSPHILRPDLPLAAGQVILRAMAKRPVDRYASGQDLATALRVALTASDIQLDDLQAVAPSLSSTTGLRLFTPRARGLFDPIWRTGVMPSQGEHRGPMYRAQQGGASVGADVSRLVEGGTHPDENTIPTQLANSIQQEETGKTISPIPPSPVAPVQEQDLDGVVEVSPGGRMPLADARPLPATNITDQLAVTNHGQGAKSTVSLAESGKIVQVPVAGQPGRYITGLLRALPISEPGQWPRGALKIIALIVAALLIVLGTGIFWFVHTHPAQTMKTRSPTIIATPNVQATAIAQATATASANIILLDPLSQNIHNWIVSPQGSKTYIFKDGAYHITNNDSKQIAPAILPYEILHQPFAYTLTMQEIKGDDTSVNNSFGMILSFNQQNKQGGTVTTFYSFEVVNAKDGEYQFWKYNDSKGPTPWTKIWHHPFGSEFHQGHGVNTFKIFVNGSEFTFGVNGKKVGTIHDNLMVDGAVGMLVNLKGTEVAFSDLKLTHY